MEFNPLIPEFKVQDIKKSLEFYVFLLNFKIEYDRPEEHFAFLSYQGSQIMIEQFWFSGDWITGQLEPPFGRGINFQIKTDDLESLLSPLRRVQYPLFAEPHEKWYREGDMFNGNRQFLVQDPDGYLLRFYQDLGQKPLSTPSSS